MAEHDLAGVESRTQELGRELYAHLQDYRPTISERVQDHVLLLLMEEPSLRTRLLRFVDVLAALSDDRSGRHTAALFREYFRERFPDIPAVFRLGLAAARSPVVPAPLLRWLVMCGTRMVASRFIVEPDEDAVRRALDDLGKWNRYPSLDILGEAVVSEQEAEEYKQGYLRLLERLGRHPLSKSRTAGDTPCLEVSLKLSSLTHQFNPADPDGTLARVRPALEEVCMAARDRGIGVTVDAEQYAYRDLTWHIFRSVVAPGEPLGQWPDAGMVVQAYLRDATSHAQEVLEFGRSRGTPIRVRLVKGAYWDYEVITAEQNRWPSPVHKDKGGTDQTYESVVRTFLESPDCVKLAVGSHNIRSHAYAEAVREAMGLPAGALEHQTLHRTLEALSRALPRMGWPTRDYVPTGELVPGMAYLVRRILENTSQSGFLTRARMKEQASELLAPPQPGAEDTSHRRPSDPTGFASTPVARFFDDEERGRFRHALEETRARWGDTYRLQLGDDMVETPVRVPSVSPSYPDAVVPVGWVHHAGLQEADRAIALASRAFPAWATRPVAERVEIGLRAAEILRARKETVAAWVVHEGGRTWSEAMADVEEAIDHVEWNALQARRLTPLIEAGYRSRGVVACIPPWNFPSALPAGMASAALMAGNAVILKPARPTPIVAQVLVDAFHEAGVPRDVLIHLPGPGGGVGSRLVESPDVDMVAFTGSKDVGEGIYRSASQVALRRGGIKRVVAELGGKNAIVVFPDADMDEAVLGILHSAFGHAGQKCSACSRVLVHRQVHDALSKRLVEGARSLPVGRADDPSVVINPVINEEARRGIMAYREAAYQEGHVLLDMLDRSALGPLCLGPLIVEVDPRRAQSARVAQEEIFGPVVALIPFDSEEEAVRVVNSPVYALALGIFSRSPSTVSRMVRTCRAGNVYVNRGITGARVGIEPFGGFQLSGTGPKAGGEEYVMAFLTRRSGFRAGALEEEQPSGQAAPTAMPQGWRTWEDTPVEERLRRLSAAATDLARRRDALVGAVAFWKGGTEEAAKHITATLDAVTRLLGAAPEIATPQPTVAIPGQDNFITWDTPRGLGVVSVDDGSDPATLAALIFRPLLAGNGVLVATPAEVAPTASAIAESAWRAGVPREVLCLAPADAALEGLAAGPVHFAAVDLALERTQALYRVLGETREAAGQRWLKALISVSDGPTPAEPGFLRLFAHPKAVAIQTLRHGADLKLV